MAALLRSACLFKFSPSGLLNLTRPRGSGPPLSRLYSGRLGDIRSGVCWRWTGRASASRVWPNTVVCARSCVMPSSQTDYSSVAVQKKQWHSFDYALDKLDMSVRRTGRVTRTLILKIFHNVCRQGFPSSNHALLLLRTCGSLLAEVPLDRRTELAHSIWDKLQNMGVISDVSHYNALLKVYLQNEFRFSPVDFIAKMEAANIEPNRVTYQRLIAAYCQNGDIEGASTILSFMKTKDLPITEEVFSSLLNGHARAGDMESAESILSVMRGAKLEPGSKTYSSLVCAYAEKGDGENMKRALEMAENADCPLMDRDIMEVVFTLAKAGHHQYIPEMLERLRDERMHIPDAINACLTLITLGQEDTALQILKTFPLVHHSRSDMEHSHQGSFFLRHCVSMNTPAEKIGHYCKVLKEINMHPFPLIYSVRFALESSNIGLSLELMKMAKEEGIPIRPHYFWPLLTHLVKNEDTAGVVQLIKSMQEFQVQPDFETLFNFVVPIFSSKDEAFKAFKDAGVSVESKEFLPLHLCGMATSSMEQLYTTMSDPSFPEMPIGRFRGIVIQAFKESSDIDSMAKITELLYNDKRFASKDPFIDTGHFLYHVVSTLLNDSVESHESKLRAYFTQLRAKNINISQSIFRGIAKLLESAQVSALIRDVKALVNFKGRMPGGSESSDPHPTETAIPTILLEKLAELKAENQPLKEQLVKAIYVLCTDGNLQGALELKRQYEDDMTPSCYVKLINLCSEQNNMEEALNLKVELNRMDPSYLVSPKQLINLAGSLIRNGRVEEALDILKEMKEKEVTVTDEHTSQFFHLLSNADDNCGPNTVQRLQDTIFVLGLAKPNTNICSPLVTAYLKRDDLAGALEAAMSCQKRYNVMPRVHDIFTALITKGNSELLEKGMDFLTQLRGERAMLYTLFFAFLQARRYNEARKIIQTPGLRAVPGRLNWFAEKCITSKQTEVLEQMVDMTDELFECDRDQMYSYVLQSYKETNDWQKAEVAWTKMQEENVIPREKTLCLLAEILKANNKEVPFSVPETWYKQDVFQDTQDYRIPILALCKKGQPTEAFEMLKECEGKGIKMDSVAHDNLIRSLLAKGLYDEAMEVRDIARSHMPGFQLSDIASSMVIITLSLKGRTADALEHLKAMLKADLVPTPVSVSKLVQAFGREGALAHIQEVESLTKSLGMPNIISNITFVNNKALAHIHNGDPDSAVELFEALYTKPDSSHPSMSFVFRKVLANGDDKALDKLSAMAERLANQFSCYRAAIDLFLELVDAGKVEDARFMLERCSALAEQKVSLVSFLANKSKKPPEIGKVQALLSLMPEAIDKNIQNWYLMKCHVLNKDLPSAKTLYEQMCVEGVPIEEGLLKRLASLYHEAGEVPPFAEPPESLRFYMKKLKSQSVSAQAMPEE